MSNNCKMENKVFKLLQFYTKESIVNPDFMKFSILPYSNKNGLNMLTVVLFVKESMKQR